MPASPGSLPGLAYKPDRLIDHDIGVLVGYFLAALTIFCRPDYVLIPAWLRVKLKPLSVCSFSKVIIILLLTVMFCERLNSEKFTKMRLLVFGLAFFTGVLSYAATYTATVTGGEWTDPATWVGGVVPPSNGAGDIVEIPAGSVVTITNQTVLFNGTVNIGGTLSLIATGFGFAVLDMDATSTVNILSGGQVTSGGGGFLAFLNGIEIGSDPFAYWPPLDGNTVTGPATITEGTGVLPIELIYFNARAKGSLVELTWATASEENFDYFAIERSVNGEDFLEIARVNGTGESATRVDYAYTDAFPMQGRTYYRLRAVDFDGYTEVFDYKMVEIDGITKDFSLYPNPIADGRFFLQTNFAIEGEAELMVYNTMGGVEMTLPVKNWMNYYAVQGLDAGTYLFRLVSAEGTRVKRVLVQ